MRCPHCRLMIGAGRSRSEPGARSAEAGLLSREARKDSGAYEADGASREEVLDAIRGAAEEIGTPPARLLMIDYAHRAEADPTVPPLRDVFAHFKSWKSARKSAATGSDTKR